MIKVVVVEDSPVIQEFLTHILSSDPQIQVIATAGDGEEALQTVRDKRPAVITMDIHMPQMDGMETTRRIMETCPTPIVIVSGSSTIDEATTAFRAMEAGALAVVKRPASIGHPDHGIMAVDLVQTVKLMSEVKVVRRWPRLHREAAPPIQVEAKTPSGKIPIIAVGASTGGPVVLESILSSLPSNFPAPILIVQHMAPGFVEGFAEWLRQATGFSVRVATHGEPLLPGRAYVAPDGFHMGVEAGGHIVLSKQEPENGLRPAISYLFRSVGTLYCENAVGIVLTGMGKDGAEELKAMKEKGAITIAQDQESALVYGIPGQAIQLGGVTYVLSPEKIAATLTSLASQYKLDGDHAEAAN